MKNVVIIFLILIIAGGIWFYWNRDQVGEEETQETLAPVSQERKFPSGFSTTGLKEKELDLNKDGKNELLLTSYDTSGAQAVLVDVKDSSNALSNLFRFPTKGFAEEYLFKPEETPEIYQTMDLNANGKEELVFDLKESGAYTTTYGIVIFASEKLDWLMLEEQNGKMRPAIFRDGSSVRNANVFKTLAKEKAIVEVSGAADKDENWRWDVKAYKWNGSKYVYAKDLSAEILAEQPKRVEP